MPKWCQDSLIHLFVSVLFSELVKNVYLTLDSESGTLFLVEILDDQSNQFVDLSFLDPSLAALCLSHLGRMQSINPVDVLKNLGLHLVVFNEVTIAVTDPLEGDTSPLLEAAHFTFN